MSWAKTNPVASFSPFLPAAALAAPGQPHNSPINVRSISFATALTGVSQTLPALENCAVPKVIHSIQFFIPFSITDYSSSFIKSVHFLHAAFIVYLYRSLTLMYDLSRVIMPHWVSLSTHPSIPPSTNKHPVCEYVAYLWQISESIALCSII